MCANPEAMKNADGGKCSLQLSSNQQYPQFYFTSWWIVIKYKNMPKEMVPTSLLIKMGHFNKKDGLTS